MTKQAFRFVLGGLTAIVAMLPLCAGSARSAEKMVDREGRVLYYMHDNGRVSDTSGRTIGYIKEDRFIDPSGRTKLYLPHTDPDTRNGNDGRSKQK